ncbi:MAG: glycosyltransferase, partial [Planctomycetes bacterium]|nr:glycosyltransferase [Planctomycetota bacterium]
TAQGITFSPLADFAFPKRLAYCYLGLPWFLDRAARVRYALEQLHRGQRFDLVQFAERGAAGFRTLQARRTGVAFTDLRILVGLHGSSRELREKNHQWMQHPEDLRLDFCERYTAEHADVLLIENETVLDAAARAGWTLRDNVWLPLPLPGSHGESAEVRLHHQRLADGYRQLLRSPAPAESASLVSEEALVTVAVTYFNLDEYLPETLAALEAQTYPHLEVLVIDDGSTSPVARRVFEEQRQRYPRFRFLSQSNAGPGAARNRCLAEARGTFFIPVDADNLPVPDMVECFVRGMQRHPEVAALGCFFLAFRQVEDIDRDEFAYAYTPTGGPHLFASLENVYGDTTSIFRTATLRAAGGFVAELSAVCEDWETLVRLNAAGFPTDVLPEPLFYYRLRGDNRSLVTTNNWMDLFPAIRSVLRHYSSRPTPWPPAESTALWTAFVSFARRVRQLDEEVQNLRRQQEAALDLHARLGQVQQEAEGLRGERQDLQGRLGKAEQRAATLQADNAHLREINQDLLTGVDQAREQAAGLHAENAQLREKNADLHSRLGQAQQQLEDIGGRVAGLLSSQEELNGRLVQEQQQRQDLQAEITRGQEANRNLHGLLGQAEAQAAVLRRESEDLREAHHALQERLQARRYRLADRLNGGLKRLPLVQPVLKRSLLWIWRIRKTLRFTHDGGQASSPETILPWKDRDQQQAA